MRVFFHDTPYSDDKCDNTSVSVIKYNKDSFNEYVINEIYDLEDHVNDENHIVWVDIKGKRDEGIIREIGKILKIHSSVAAYLCNPSQLPRFEIYDSFQLLIMNHFSMADDNKVHISPISVLIGNNIIMTVQNGALDPFADIRSALRSGNIRTSGLDYLVYAFIDVVINSHYPVINSLGKMLEELENNVITNKRLDNNTGTAIHKLSRRFMFAYRALWNHKDALNDFINNSDIVAETKNSHFLRRCYDYSLEILEVVQMYIDMSKNLMNVYLAVVNNRINEVMKVLTITVSIFAPITMVSGIYGMNFTDMPGLHEWWGFPLTILEMLGASSIMLIIFRKMGFLK